MTQVKAIYDFTAEPNSGELSITTDEILTVVREGIEGGWLEGRNSKGQHGLFPEAYVIKIPPISLLPQIERPSIPASYSVPPGDDEWALPPAPIHKPHTYEQKSANSGYQNQESVNRDEDDFDEWTDDDDDEEKEKPKRKSFAVEDGSLLEANNALNAHSRTPSASRTDLSTDNDDFANNSESIRQSVRCRTKEVNTHSGREPGTQSVSRSRSAGADIASSKQGTMAKMKAINRFSNFVKSGMENYVLSTSKFASLPDEHHEITLTSTGAQWMPISQPYSCVVDKPKKESKLKGLKSFIAYSVTSSLSGIQVSRRYKHFDWLHEQLSAKYILIPIPPLPEKQVAGRYEDELIEHRKSVLQIWVNKISRHPVLSKSDVWIHFLTCTDEKQWKNGKRKAERDEYVGGNFLHCISVPSQSLDSNKVEIQIDSFARFVRSLDDSVRNMYDRFNERHKRLAGPYKANWQKLAASFSGLGHSFEMDTSTKNQKVTAALKETAHIFHKIGDEYEESSKRDIDPLLESLYCSKGLLSSIPDIFHVHKTAMSKLRENERFSMEGKVAMSESERVRSRVDSVSYAVLAEIDFQHHEVIEDFRQMMALYLKRQAAFYENIGKQLSALSSLFDNA